MSEKVGFIRVRFLYLNQLRPSHLPEFSPSGLIGMVLTRVDMKEEGMGKTERKIVPFFSPFKNGKFYIL